MTERRASPTDLSAPLTADAVRTIFRTHRAQPPHTLTQRGDHDGNPGWGIAETLREAAVLVPLIDRSEGLHVLLTQRTAHLTAHAGQIAFPGGRLEHSDADAIAAALRETEEEIGLPHQHIEIIGRLDDYLTRTGFRVAPVVGIIRPPFTTRPDPYEVADIFEVPLGFLLDPANRRRNFSEFRGAMRQFWSFPYGERNIWGATAGMIVNLCDVLAPDVQNGSLPAAEAG